MAELSSRVAAAFRRPAAEQDTIVPDPHSHTTDRTPPTPQQRHTETHLFTSIQN